MLLIKGEPATKKNSQVIRYKKIGQRKVPFIAQSERYTAYEKAALIQLKLQNEDIGKPPYNVQCIYYRSNMIHCDLVNLLEATDDILTRAGIIEDDWFGIVASHNGSCVKIDKENPRTEITITAYGDKDDYKTISTDTAIKKRSRTR